MVTRPAPPATAPHAVGSWRPSRRVVLAGTAWSLPAITVAAAVPAMAASAGTLAVLGADGDRNAGTGFVTISLSPAASDAVVARARATYSDSGAATVSFQRVGGDARTGLYRLSFVTSSPPPDTVTVTLVVDGYGSSGPVRVDFAAGTLDTSFANPRLDSSATGVAVQPDGRILVCGSFTNAGGQLRRGLARFLPDGTLDTTFADPGIDATAFGVALQPDGRILVAGEFLSVGGESRRRLARINGDGTLDTTFADPGLDATAYGVALGPQGTVVVTGDFSQAGEVTRQFLARFAADGTLDPGFADPGLSDSGYAVAVRDDGKVLVAGFLRLGDGSHLFVARFDADGTLDPTFANPGIEATGLGLAIQSDGQVLVAGSFPFRSQNRDLVARVGTDGRPDPGFAPTVRGTGNGVVVQSDGSILVGGDGPNVNGRVPGLLVRLRPDGSVDPSFTSPAINAPVSALALDARGRILVAGAFSRAGGQDRSFLARFRG